MNTKKKVFFSHVLIISFKCSNGALISDYSSQVGVVKLVKLRPKIDETN